MLPSSSLELIADLTANGCGIGILPHSIAASRDLVKVINAPSYSDEICLLYHNGNRDIKALQEIGSAIKKIYGKNISQNL